MQCKRFDNPKTGKRYFFIDGKRVSQEFWYFSETLAQMKGLQYNSSWGMTRKDGVIVSGHCFN